MKRQANNMLVLECYLKLARLYVYDIHDYVEASHMLMCAYYMELEPSLTAQNKVSLSFLLLVLIFCLFSSFFVVVVVVSIMIDKLIDGCFFYSLTLYVYFRFCVCIYISLSLFVDMIVLIVIVVVFI